MSAEFQDAPPCYILVEGVGGCGKSTAVKFVSEAWERLTGRKVVTTREPGGTERAERIRAEIFAAKKNRTKTGLEIVEMFYDARNSLVSQVIRPALRQRLHVVSDRGYPSTFAYEGGGEGVSEQDILAVHRKRLGQWGADVTFYLRLPEAAEGLRRKSHSFAGDSFDEESDEYFRRVIRFYDRLAKENGDPKKTDSIFGLWITVDATVSVEEVRGQLAQTSLKYLELRSAKIAS